jgi:hypothetical protein
MSALHRPSFLLRFLLILFSTLACARITGMPTPTPVVNSSDPHVEISADATTLAIGDLVTVTGQAVDIGLPYFYVSLKDSGAIEFAELVAVTYENQIKNSADVSQVLELVSVEGDYGQAVITLRARAVGSTEIAISATGEVHSSQGYMWSGGGSEPLTITVTGP